MGAAGALQGPALGAAQAAVKVHLNSRTDPQTGQKVLVFMSDQLVTLDESPGREWQLSELRTTVVGGQADVEAFLDTPMRAADTHVLNSQLCHSEKLHPSTLYMPEGLNCACWQLSQHLSLDYARLWDALREHHDQRYEGDFDEKGYVTPAVLIDYCVANGHSAYFLQGNALRFKHVAHTHKKGVAFQAHDGHCWLYTTCQPFMGMQVRAPKLIPTTVLPSAKRGAFQRVERLVALATGGGTSNLHPGPLLRGRPGGNPEGPLCTGLHRSGLFDPQV
jgi:hypothetical protein